MYQVNYEFTEQNYHYYPRVVTPPGIFGDAVDQGQDGAIQVRLEDDQLWKSFSAAGTEMIITKLGRRMFPGLRCSVQGLNPAEKYCLVLDIAPCDQKRYKFTDGEWKVGGRAEPQHHRRFFIHPDSPNTGAHWTSNQISFRTAKLTNNLVNDPNMIVLNSMHKYQPRILILKCDDLEKINYVPSYSSYIFPSTSFIAVTAYQNSQVTKLKIAHNPFAKGFRERQSQTRKRPALEVHEQPQPKRQIVSSPEPVVEQSGLPDYNHVYHLNESPSSGSTSTNSSFSSGPPEQVGYQLQTDFYPFQPITNMYDPNEVYVYNQQQSWTEQSVHNQSSSDYSLNETNQSDNFELNLPSYPVFPIYE